jgi:hypothetical protein
MSLYEKVYSESVKDIIGNDPVLDQFDIFYEASYYGTVQDDYVTGSLINKLSDPNAPRNYTIATGSRGRVLSKFYASSHPQLPTAYGSTSVTKIPSLSFRITPWTSRVSRTSFRLTQAFDANERYYDSCLPDLNNCFAANGSKPWTVKNNSPTVFSPYNNFQTGSSDVFLVFNYIEKQVPGYEKDPTVNNEWTWSFPYESRYLPTQRNVNTDSSFGLTQISTTSDLDIVEPINIYPRNFEFWETSTTENFSVVNVSLTQSKTAKVFRPILPGLNSSSRLRNSLRQTLSSPLLGENGGRYILPTSYNDSTLDSSYGYSLLIPSDTNLLSTSDHSFLSTYGIPDPGNEPLTGSMFPSDTVKFLFGFGDLNTITYIYRNFEPSNAQTLYTEGFEGYTEGDTLTQSNSETVVRGLKTSWSGDWVVREKAGDVVVNGITSSYYPSSTEGIYWTKNINNTKILFSDTVAGSTEEKIQYLHITSSYPWSIGFDFSVASDDPGDYFKVTITGSNWIDTNFLLLDTKDKDAPDVFFRDNSSGEGFSETFTKLPGENKVYDPPGPTPPINYSTGGTYDWSVVGAKGDSAGQYYFTGSNSYPIPAGEYRLTFRYSTQGAAGIVTCTAIDNLYIKVYDENCFPPDTSKGRMGGNNYPEFRQYTVDSREDPTYSYNVPSNWGSGAGQILQDKTSLIYSGIHYGINPIIRGWKYGLINGFPQHTKTIFRRGRYGQLRDMLEQRQYSRFINVNNSPVDYEAITIDGLEKTLNEGLTVGSSSGNGAGESAVSVRFLKKIVNITPRGIGTIQTVFVNPAETTSQNLSSEVTSSLPYYDGYPRHRTETEMMSVNRSSYVDTVIQTQTDAAYGL